MEHLTKQQIVLTLLVSFVTSIATGIVTVSLVDQAPVGVTRTINNIIEKTVQQVTPSDNSNQAAVINSGVIAADPQSRVSTALAAVQKSLVTIKIATGVDANGNPVGSTTGMGLVISKNGTIVTDKAAIALVGAYVAVLPNGKSVPVVVTRSQDNGDLVVLSAQPSSSDTLGTVFIPVQLAASTLKLGQTILSLSGGDSPTLGQGIVTNVDTSSATPLVPFTTSLDLSKATSATVLFTDTGGVVGFETLSNVLYPVSVIKSAMLIQ